MIQLRFVPRPDLGDRRTQHRRRAAPSLARDRPRRSCVQIGTGNMLLALAGAPCVARAALLVAALQLAVRLPVRSLRDARPVRQHAQDRRRRHAHQTSRHRVDRVHHRARVHRARARRARRRALWLVVRVPAVELLLTVMWTPDTCPGIALHRRRCSLIAAVRGARRSRRSRSATLRAICACIIIGGVAASLYGIYLLHNSPQMAGDYGPPHDQRRRPLDRPEPLRQLAARADRAVARRRCSHARKPVTVLGSLVALAILIGRRADQPLARRRCSAAS